MCVGFIVLKIVNGKLFRWFDREKLMLKFDKELFNFNI